MASSFRIDVIIINTILNLFLYYNCLNLIPYVQSSRADLGTYLHIAPAVEEKSPEDLYVLAFINYTYIDDGREVYYSEEKGRYGEGKILNVQGFLEHITSSDDYNDHTACTLNLRGTNGNPLPSYGNGKPWIALIRRGKCTFEEKIKYTWKHGAVGVIVYNEIPAVSLEKMKIIEKDRNITAIFTYKWIGEELGRIVDGGNHIWVSISEGQRGMKPQHNINNFATKIMNLLSYTRHLFALNGTSVLFVSISFIVLMIISLVWLIFYYIQRFRYLQSKDQHSRHLCAVAKRVIMKIPTKNGKTNDDKDSENDCCAICIEPYKATDCIRVLPCNHEFHKNCIDPWLLEHRTCPMCKLDVLKHYGFVYIGSEESILQLDLDMEIGDHGLNNSIGDDDRFSIDNNNSRINHIPTFHIQNFDDHSHLVRNLSFEIANQIHHIDDLPERSQSSLSCINRMLDETVTNKLFSHNQQQQQSRSSQSGGSSSKDDGKDSKNNTMKFNNFLNPDYYKKDKESISLPGTLKKKRSSTTDSCRGSNNCYIKSAAADLKQLAAKIEKGCPKSRTGIVRQASDDEHLLDNMNDNSTEMIETISTSKKSKKRSTSPSNSKTTDIELQTTTTVVGSTLESETKKELSHSMATTGTVPTIAIVSPQKNRNETEQSTSGCTSSSSSSKQKP